MQGDVTPPDPAGTTGPHGREGPRHAAPRKSLLSKLQTPTGKVIALAAMPTAVLMGMGLTPRLAIADDRIPYAPGPCVTRSDEPSPGEKPAPGPSGTAEPSDTPSPGASSAPDPRPGESGEAGEAGEGGTGGEPGGPGDTGDTGVPDGAVTPEGAVRKKAAAPPTAAPSKAARSTAARSTAVPSTASAPPGPGGTPASARTSPPALAPASPPSAKPSPGKTYDPWDPLGLGDAIKDLFDPDDVDEPEDPEDPDDPDDSDGPGGTPAPPAAKPKPKPTPKPTPKPDPTATGPAAGQRPKPGTTQRPAAKDPAHRPGDTGRDGGTTDRTKKSITDAARRVGADVEELDEAAKSLEPRPDTDIPDGAVPRFPCPEADPEALAAAKEESGIPGLPDDPWTLESTRLTLRGLDYHGIVQVRTGSGGLKPALKFTASSLDIKDLHQLTVATMGRTMHARARPGSTSTIRDGTVTMYTEELKGDLFGIIPVTFSPATPPPLNIPFAFFTDVTIRQAGQFGGTLTIPGLRNYLTDGDTSS
ncbi:hypothetical protein ABZ714_18565 [Streptomyces sp. NPDC006798]|uniref:hypothetical protein n=1 Tax=Streptomyces sp. NPDC006798 TaxID=3155462 RepID=UPI0033CDE863